MAVQGSGKAGKRIAYKSLAEAVLILIVGGALGYVLYFTHGAASESLSILLLLYGFFCPLYLLIRMVLAYLQTKWRRTHPQPLAVTESPAKQTVAAAPMRVLQADGPVSQSGLVESIHSRTTFSQPPARGKYHLFFHALHLRIWELATFSTMLLIFALATHHWRKTASLNAIAGLGTVLALLFWVIVGLEMLHHFWDWLHPRIFKRYVSPPPQARGGALTPTQKLFYGLFVVLLLWAMAELFSAPKEASVVLFSLVAPGVVLLLLYGLWTILASLWSALSNNQTAHKF